RAAAPALAFYPDAPLHQLHQLPADGQAQTTAAVLACNRRIGLGKRLEDQLLLFRRYADAGILHGKGELRRSAGDGTPDLQLHRSFFGEFDGIPDEIEEDLVEPVAVAGKAFRYVS